MYRRMLNNRNKRKIIKMCCKIVTREGFSIFILLVIYITLINGIRVPWSEVRQSLRKSCWKLLEMRNEQKKLAEWTGLACNGCSVQKRNLPVTSGLNRNSGCVYSPAEARRPGHSKYAKTKEMVLERKWRRRPHRRRAKEFKHLNLTTCGEADTGLYRGI